MVAVSSAAAEAPKPWKRASMNGLTNTGLAARYRSRATWSTPATPEVVTAATTRSDSGPSSGLMA